MRPAYGKLTLIGCGLVFSSRTCNDRHFQETVCEVSARTRLVAIIKSTKARHTRHDATGLRQLF